VPYRSMVPKNVENMLMTGKLVSVTEDFKRDLLPDNIVWGQAAGIAAALCAKKGITPRQMEKDSQGTPGYPDKTGRHTDRNTLGT